MGMTNGESQLPSHRKQINCNSGYDQTRFGHRIPMANTKGVANLKNAACSGKQSLLPPKCPFPSVSPAYADYGSNSCLGSNSIPKPRESNKHHQRTSSESFLLIEEQPSWLDDLLNEPETPVRRGAHRRSSSDSFAYLDASSICCNIDNIAQEELKHKSLVSRPSWGSQELDHRKEMQYSSYYIERSSFGRTQNRGWGSSLNIIAYPGNLASTSDKVVHQSPGPTDAIREPDAATSMGTDKKDQEESIPQDSERREVSHANLPQSEVDSKRVKQKFAQRSRVRKLQYIAELERNVQALQAEISEVSAEMEFLDQQNLILNLENKTLKQRLDSVAQEQLIKCFQQEMLEREISRLRALHQQQQQQQQPQQPTPSHGRTGSRDLDTQFASLSLKHTRQILDGTQ